MATDDQQVLVVGQAAAPTHTTIPGNGQIQPKAIFATYDGTSTAGAFLPAIKITSDGGELVGVYPTCTSVAAGGSAEVSWFPGVKCCPPGVVVPGVALETLFLDSAVGTITSSTVLASGQSYVITVQGTYSLWNLALAQGTPDANAMFPGSVAGRVSTQVGVDAECVFAFPTGNHPTLGHTNAFQVNLGSGASHIEPSGGPFATRQPGNLYTYPVVGRGSAATFTIADTPIADNYGLLRIMIQEPGSGGGSGSLVPAGGTDHAILRSSAGIPVWEARPDVVESDLSLSDVTTANVSISAHGLAPKAPNDSTKFLNGVGGYTVPAGGSGTISDITSTGSTITVTAPTGPTTNVDLPTSGVVAATYGSSSNVAQVTVNAEGIVTAAANVSIGGGVVVGADGWVDDSAETWTFASFAAGPPAVGTFTVSGDVTAKYTIGTRIKLTQTTIKYFVVSAAPVFGGGSTTVTISGGTDFTLANAAISANAHSYVINPQGFPSWFNFAAAAAGFSAKTSDVGRFNVFGRNCNIFMNIQGTSNVATFTWTAPIVAVQSSVSVVSVTTTGTVTAIGRAQSTAGSSTITMGLNSSTAPVQIPSGGFPTTGSKGAGGQFWYEV